LLQVAVEALRDDAQDAGYAGWRTAFKARADRVARPSLITHAIAGGHAP